MDEPIIVTNGKFSIFIETKKSIKNADFGKSIQLAPHKPDDAIVWKDIGGRNVFKNPRTGHWKYYPTPKDTATRMDKGARELEEAKRRGTQNKNVKTERPYVSSEKLIVSLLSTNDDESKSKLKEEFESDINKTEAKENAKKKWIDSTYNSFEVIQNFLKENNMQIKRVIHVGNKVQEDRYYTADLLIETNKGTLGVSLKKLEMQDYIILL